ncbi:MAG: hypothetical protein GY705_23880 [Bacteroidetes bacterium]|nr:hypothetical protein [Bacteroidota bacterium]
MRIRRICSDENDFVGHCLNLIRHFRRRGYPIKLLEEALYQAQSRDRDVLLKYKPKLDKKDDTFFLTTTYNPHNSLLKDIVKNNWDILGKNTTTDYIYKKKLVCGFRRPKNLRDHLMRAKVPPKIGDEKINPFSKPMDPIESKVDYTPKAQKSITDFFKPSTKTLPTPIQASASLPNLTKKRPRGFNFCRQIVHHEKHLMP